MPQKPPTPDLVPQNLGHLELYTAEEVAQLLRVSRTTVYGMMSRGDLAYVHIGRLRRVTQRSLQAYIDRFEEGRFS